MTNRTRFIVNTALLTVSELVMRCVGCAFQVWLAGRMGSAGMGLFQLISSVTGLAVTFAVSGISFGTTRLVSEELGADRPNRAVAAMTRCAVYALIFGTATAAVLYRFAEPIGFLCIEDGRTVLPLRIFALELPFLSLGSVFHGWFTARSRVGRSTAVQVAQQLGCMGLTMWLLGRVPSADVEANCLCITLAGTAAEAVGCFIMAGLYLWDARKTIPALRSSCAPHRDGAAPLTLRLLRIALPLGCSAWTRSGLSTIQHMLIPSGLRRAGLTAAGALSVYGMIHGMALTVIWFPTCILQVAARLLMPHLTRLQVGGLHRRTEQVCVRLLGLGLVYAGVSAVGLFLLAEPLARWLYRTPEAAVYIRLLSVLVPVIDLDILVDGCLKGLGQQLWSMGINIVEAAISVVLTPVLIPCFGVKGYLLVIAFNEVFNFALSFWKLRRVLRNDL